MADQLFLELEEKLIAFLSEREAILGEKQLLQQEINRLNQENTSLKGEREKSMQKLHDLLGLMKSIHEESSEVDNLATAVNLGSMKPVLVQA